MLGLVVVEETKHWAYRKVLVLCLTLDLVEGQLLCQVLVLYIDASGLAMFKGITAGVGVLGALNDLDDCLVYVMAWGEFAMTMLCDCM